MQRIDSRHGTARRFLTAGAAAAFLLALGTAPLLSGCELAVGAGAATGIAAYQERGVEGAAGDLKIQLNVLDKWLNSDGTLARKLSIEVYDGRVLLTGVVTDEKMRADAVRLTWQAAGVKEVLNEVQLPGEVPDVSVARDSWITTQLKSKITLDKKIYAVNYFIETVNGIVYLIGAAQNQAELDRVIAHAKELAYVRKVISHIQVKKPKAKPST